MATRKNNIPKEPEQEELEMETVTGEEPAEEPGKDAAETLAEENARLKAQIEALKKSAAGGKESDYDRVHRIEAECVAAGVDLFTVEVEVLVPHREKTEDPYYWISVNGRTVQIPANDRYQKMRLPFALVLVDTLKYERHSADYQDSLEVFDPVDNPHK